MTEPAPPAPVRDYNAIADAVADAMPRDADADARMRIVADLLWSHLHEAGVSWCGFYVDQPEAPDDQRLVLGPSRDTPACSPIGLHGACGQSFVSQETLIVHDVADLGDGYIACDPRDQSEIVIPLLRATADGGRESWAVLDLDSFDVGAFDDRDDVGLRYVLRAAGLMW